MSGLSETSPHDESVEEAMGRVAVPRGGHVSVKEVLGVLLGWPGAVVGDLRSLPLGQAGQRLMAWRYFLRNGPVWLRYFAWESHVAGRDADAPERVRELGARVQAARDDSAPTAAAARAWESVALDELATQVEGELDRAEDVPRLLLALDADDALRARVRERLVGEAGRLCADAPRAADVLYLATQDLNRFPATTVGEGRFDHVIVADKGEMGVRAVREAVATGRVPVVLFSAQDDAGALQVREAEAAGGFGIALEGSFRETYASFVQIARRIHEAYAERYGDDASEVLGRSALYPGYGPLAENAAAIAHFRRNGIVFVGPGQDTVGRAGDKREFRRLAQSLDPESVTPGIILDTDDPQEILEEILEAHRTGVLGFPGRIKAANGGGGRGQAIIPSPSGVGSAVAKVMGEIQANGWDPGVMFEQNIPETIHLEVQIVRDRFGGARHFGMRDCSEQRASQKIQEEAPPALLRGQADLEARMCALAVSIAHSVEYVGAGTVELMYKDGRFYLLEMNTRIQVEHPVTEAAHRVLVDGESRPLNLVQLQLHVAAGRPIPFEQDQIVQTHVAREFRINAESWKPDVKDARDGGRGLFLPNAGVFDRIELPDAAKVRAELQARGVRGIEDLTIRFDCGFETGDRLVNKDPTFGKLIVAVRAGEGHEEVSYALLQRASAEVLARMVIEGRQVMPNGKIIRGSTFETNLRDHIRVLNSDCLRRHAEGDETGRHVNWVVSMLRDGDTDPG